MQVISTDGVGNTLKCPPSVNNTDFNSVKMYFSFYLPHVLMSSGNVLSSFTKWSSSDWTTFVCKLSVAISLLEGSYGGMTHL